MRDWFAFALLAFLVFGVWGLCAKIATNYVSSQSAVLYGVIGSALVGILYAAFLIVTAEFQPEFRPLGVIFAVLTGMTGTLGTLFVLYSLSRGGKASVVVPMTALYPVLTILLAALLLREEVTMKQALGMIFAIVAIVLFSR